MLWTNNGYNNSVIFSLLAKSKALSNGIQTPLRCIGPILTTCRTFSLFRIPSLLPRVIPATLRSFVPFIMWLSSRRATQIPLASTWKHKLPSSSQSVAVTRGFIPGGATWPVVSKPWYWFCMPPWLGTPGRGRTFWAPIGPETAGGAD